MTTKNPTDTAFPDYDGEVVERIEKKDMVPLNDPNCTHEHLERGDDQIGKMVEVHCSDCPIGWFVSEREALRIDARE